jgi:uncharacterized YigZ family protein
MAEYYRPTEINHRTEILVINSRFITTIGRATTAEMAREFIAKIRAEMANASHHVYAFRVGYGNSITEGMSDDGEPSGTSGPPSLAVLRGSDLGDIVLVTTRYFGGTKLGTGGLVRAYSESARMALTSLKTESKAPKSQFGMDIPYSLFEQVKLLIEKYEGSIDDEIFAGDVTLIATFLQEVIADFEAELANLSSGQVEPILLETFED